MIYSKYVLTAAHCLERYDFKKMVVIAGLNSLEKKPEHINTYYVLGVILNPKYQREKVLNDIAVMKLDRDVEFSSETATICLPRSKKSSNDVLNKNVILTGWYE